MCLQPRAWDTRAVDPTAGHAADRAAYLEAQGRPQPATEPLPVQNQPVPNVQQQAKDRAAPNAQQQMGERPAAAAQQQRDGDRAASDAQQQTEERPAAAAVHRTGSCDQERAGQQQLQAGGPRRQGAHQCMQPQWEPAAAASRDKPCSEAEGRTAEGPADEPGAADEGDAADEPEEPAAAALADAGLPPSASAQTGPTSGGLAVTSGATAACTSRLLHVTPCHTSVRLLKQARFNVPVCCPALPARTSVCGDLLAPSPALSARLQCLQRWWQRTPPFLPSHLSVPTLTAARPVLLQAFLLRRLCCRSRWMTMQSSSINRPCLCSLQRTQLCCVWRKRLPNSCVG